MTARKKGKGNKGKLNALFEQKKEKQKGNNKAFVSRVLLFRNAS